MDLDFTEEQEMLRNLVRGVCNDHAPLNVVRELEDDPVGYPTDLWKQLSDLDLIGLLLPAQYGGSGMSLIDGTILYSEFGRALVPSPHFVSAVLAGGVLVRGGDEAQKQAWLPKIATGDTIFSVAWIEPGNGFSPSGVQTTAEPVDGGSAYRLTGTKRHVSFANSAERLVVLARTAGSSADDPAGIGLYLVAPTQAGTALEQQFTVASDNQFEVTLDGVIVESTDRIGPRGPAGGGTRGDWAIWNAVMRDAAILLAAQAIGGAQAALEMTVQYAKDRVQFDKPLGAFQALAHYLADAKTNVDGGEALVWEAAWAAAEGRAEAAKLAPMAKLFACQTFRDVTAMAQQIHGGIGFSIECDIQLYFRRAKAMQLNYWDTRYLEQLVAAAVLD